MGCGKSSVGEKIAGRLDIIFVDMDKVIEESNSTAINRIFEEQGEKTFREFEQNALHQILELDDVVVATGGGAPCFFNNMELMNKNGITVYMKGEPEFLANRLLNAKSERPLIKGKSKEELIGFIKEKLKEREEYYLRAQHTVNAKDLKTEEIIKLLKI